MRLVAAVGFLLLAVRVDAYFVAGEFTSRAGASQRERNYNIRIGRLQLDLEASMRAIADDNSNRAGDTSEPQETTTLEYGMDIGVFWPISYDLKLDATFYVGYSQLLSGQGVEGLLIRATESTALAVDMRAGQNGILSFVDTISTSVNSVDFGIDEDPGELYILQNDAAVQYEHQLSKPTRLALRLGQFDTFSLNDAFKNRDRKTHYAAFRVDWRPTRDDTIFPYGRYNEHFFPEELHNNGTEYELGLGWIRQLNQNLRLQMSLGYQVMDFDPSHVPPAIEDVDGFSGKLVLINQLSKHVNHALTAKYFRRLGTGPLVNFNTDFAISHRFDWGFSRRWHLSLVNSWLRSRQSGPTGLRETFLSNEVQIGYRFDILSAFVGYNRTQKFSELSAREFVRNQVTLGFKYDF